MFSSLMEFLNSIIAGSFFDSLLNEVLLYYESIGDLYPLLFYLLLFYAFALILVCLTVSFVFKFLLKLVD